LDWSEDTLSSCLTSIYLSNQANIDPVTQEMVYWHPLTLLAKATSSDTQNWNQAMNGPYTNGYWDAMDKVVETLTDKYAWVEVARQQRIKEVPSTWAFRVKRLPDGSFRKLKARLCVRGDQQTIGVDFLRRMPLCSLGPLSELYIPFQQSTIYHHTQKTTQLPLFMQRSKKISTLRCLAEFANQEMS